MSNYNMSRLLTCLKCTLPNLNNLIVDWLLLLFCGIKNNILIIYKFFVKAIVYYFLIGIIKFSNQEIIIVIFDNFSKSRIENFILP